MFDIDFNHVILVFKIMWPYALGAFALFAAGEAYFYTKEVMASQREGLYMAHDMEITEDLGYIDDALDFPHHSPR